MEINETQDQLLTRNFELHETAKQNTQPGLDLHLVNIKMSSVISRGSAIALNQDLDRSTRMDQDVTQLMIDMCREIGDSFINAPDAKQFNEAINGSTMIAYKFVPLALKAYGISVDLDEVVDKADMLDVLKDFAKRRQVEIPVDFSSDQCKELILQSLEEDDTFGKEAVQELEFNSEELTPEENNALKIAIAFAQAGYLQAQPFRQIRTNKDRINRPQFNLNPVMKDIMYSSGQKISGMQLGGIAREGFEVWKDVIELKKARNAKMAS